MQRHVQSVLTAVVVLGVATSAFGIEPQRVRSEQAMLQGSGDQAISTASVLDSSLVGKWDGPYAWPVVAIHAFVLPTGKVLHFSFPGEIQNPNAYVWDPLTGDITPVPVNRPLFCSGHSFLGDGRLLVTGGNGPAPPGEFRGIRDTHIFDPFTETWTRVEDMADGRWYPTNVTLADGRVLVFSGLDELTGAINDDVEIYDPSSPGGWQVVSQVELPLYPRTHMASSGNVFLSGPWQTTGTLELGTWSWYGIVPFAYGSRWDGLSVPLPPGPDRMMAVGGRDFDTVTETAEIIDLSDPSPAWQYTQPMSFPRMHANAVILPDGGILVVGGHSDLHEEKDVGQATAVYEAEMFDPDAETWSVMAPLIVPRVYHSTAVLLPSGRVLVGGSDGEFTVEVYSPPYLFRGARPVIQSAPAAIAYGSSFDLSFTSSTDTNAVALVRLSSVTHSVNMDQRYVFLGELTSGDGLVPVSAPAEANLAPPGYYMMFVVDATGVPSVAAMVRVEEPPACVCPNQGDVAPLTGPGDGIIDVLDVVALIDEVFRSGPTTTQDVTCPNGRGDIAPASAGVECGDGLNDVLDVVGIIDNVFRSGPPLCDPCSP